MNLNAQIMALSNHQTVSRRIEWSFKLRKYIVTFMISNEKYVH